MAFVFFCIVVVFLIFFYMYINSENKNSFKSPLLTQKNPEVLPKKEIVPDKPKQELEIPNVNFVAIDFETANKNYSSACSLGIAVVKNGNIVETRHWLIKPPYNRFEFTSLHGIGWQHVKNRGTFEDLWNEIQPYLQDEILVAHNAYGFDMRVLEDLTQFYNIEFEVLAVWDTLDIAKNTWSLPNYKLDTVCKHLNIDLNHHHAESDAIAAAWIALHGLIEDRIPQKKALKQTKSKAPTQVRKKRKVKIEAEDFDDSTIDGKTIVFTGELDSMSREEAIEAAESAGAIIRTGISRKTNFLVVGTQVATIGDRSVKELKVEGFISEGYPIRVLSEEEFLEMI